MNSQIWMTKMINQRKKGKKGKKGKNTTPVVAKEEEVDMTTPYRGKPSSFFVMLPAKEAPEQPDPVNPMGLEMNDE